MSGDGRIVALVPAWNAAEFIERTLQALSDQTYPNLEILVSVDLSTDETATICEAYSRKDPRVRVIRQVTRQGFVGNTRQLLRQAHGEYLCWAWHDDLLHPDYMSKLVTALESHPRAVCAFSDVELHHLNGDVSTFVHDAFEGLETPVERARLALWSGTWWVPTRGVYRSWAMQQVGGFRRHWAGEFKCDWPWAVHMAILGDHIRVPGVLCTKYFRVSSISYSWHIHRWNNAAALVSCAREIQRSALPAATKARLYLSVASVLKMILTTRYHERPADPRVLAHYREAQAAEQKLMSRER